jgi:hypothetical protein
MENPYFSQRTREKWGTQITIKGKNKIKNRIKGSGQECPLHTIWGAC